MLTTAPSDPAHTIDLGDLIDKRGFSRFQIVTFLLCAAVGLSDGFDLQIMGYLIPTIARSLALPPSAFGPVLSAGFIGVALGSSFVAPLADRFGRKRVVIASILIFSTASLLTATVGSLWQLIAWRTITGIGLGAAMPNLITLASEYAPQRVRAFVVTALFTGLSAGAMTGGLASSLLLPQFGWRAVFLAGGLAPLMLLPFLLAFLPESARFLVLNGYPPERIGRVLRRIDPGVVFGPATCVVTSEATAKKVAFSELFSDRRALGTSGLWLSFFMNLFVLAFLASWLPTILRDNGFSLERAIVAVTVMNLGGVVGSFVVGFGMDRVGPQISLALTGAVCAVLLASFAVAVDAGTTFAVVMVWTFAIGFCVQGGQSGLNAFAAEFYPTTIRSTGVGWAFGVGRIGSILSPLAGAAMLGMAWTHIQIFVSAAIPMIIVAAGVTVVRVRVNRAAALAVAETVPSVF